jgi:predicted amidophosphoribosyltransferase
VTQENICPKCWREMDRNLDHWYCDLCESEYPVKTTHSLSSVTIKEGNITDDQLRRMLKELDESSERCNKLQRREDVVFLVSSALALAGLSYFLVWLICELI